MKKDFTRDYATEAFRLYAAMGKLSYEEATKQIYEAALNDCEFKDPEIANISAEAAVNNATPLLLDILAVEKTIDILERGNKTHIARAISDVYFVQPEQPLRRGDIKNLSHNLWLNTKENIFCVFNNFVVITNFSAYFLS